MTEQACRFVLEGPWCETHDSFNVYLPFSICDLGLAALRGKVEEQTKEMLNIAHALALLGCNPIEPLAPQVEVRIRQLMKADNLMEEQARVIEGLRGALEDIASGELGINVAIKHAKKALFPTKEMTDGA